MTTILKEFQARGSTLANILGNIQCLLRDKMKKMFSTKLEDSTKEQLNRAKKYLERKTPGQLLLISADQSRYNDMKNNMQLNMAMGTNNYPNFLKEKMNIMNTHQQIKKFS